MTWFSPRPGTSTAISARPPTVPPGWGVRNTGAGAAADGASRSLARHTTVDSGGTVRVSLPSGSALSLAFPAGRSCVNIMRPCAVGTGTVLAVVALFDATTYSTCWVGAMRLKAYTPAALLA